jgi:sec-independent protein translocase protein TatB
MIPISDLLLLMLLALLIFGPRRLPEIGRMVGKALAEFRKASNELRRSINAELALEEHEPPRPYLAPPPPSAAAEAAHPPAPLASIPAAAGAVGAAAAAETAPAHTPGPVDAVPAAAAVGRAEAGAVASGPAAEPSEPGLDFGSPYESGTSELFQPYGAGREDAEEVTEKADLPVPAEPRSLH